MAGAYQPKHLPKHSPTPSTPPAARRAPWIGLACGGVAVVVAGAAVVWRGADPPATTLTGAGADVAAADEDIAVCVRAALSERAGRTLVLGLPGVTDADDPLVARFADAHVGGVMLREENVEDEEQARALVDGLRAQLGEHVLIALDDEGGRVSSLGALGESIPSARRLGAQGPEAARAAGEELGELAASIGVDWLLAPVTDLDAGPSDGVIGDRSFGDDPAAVTEAAGAFIAGARDHGLKVTLKHFPGHRGEGDPHTGATVSDATLAELQADELGVFRALTDAGADAVMLGHVEYPAIWDGGRPASLQPDAYRLLRASGFDGVAVTDALGMGAVHARWGFDVAPAMALAAGADAVLVNQGDQVEILRDGLLAAVEAGTLDEDRLDDAVRHVLDLQGQDPTGIVCNPPPS